MGTTTDKLEAIIDTKSGLKSIIEENNVTVPTAFSDYPSTFDTIIENYKNIIICMDTIYINSSTTTAQLNALFNALPVATSYTRNTNIVKGLSGINVRATASNSGALVGKFKGGDIAEILDPSSTSNYRKINRYRAGTSYSNPLKTYSTPAYVYTNTDSVSITTGDVMLKKIDITVCSETVQKACKYSIAEKKGWEIIFSTVDEVEVTAQEVTYSFNNCYTDNYSSSSYSNKVSTNSSTLRQGYWSGYYYYKGNIRFTSSRLAEVKSILTSSTINSIRVYLERANTTHGQAAASTVCLYACDSTGTNSAVAVDTSTTLTRGQGTWITLSDTIKNGFISGKYDHFKVYKASTSMRYYIVYETNAKMKINYTA